MSHHLEHVKGLVMGTPRYLFTEPSKYFNSQELLENSVFHYKRPIVDNLKTCDDPGLFWSLCFSIRGDDFQKLGGFDENYHGYGGEDTDLSFTSKKMGMPFHLSSSAVFHQQHGFYSPPVDKIESVIDNCNYFKFKWGKWCMQKHLKAFTSQGYINWKEGQSEPVKINRIPTPFVLEQFYVKDQPYA